MSARLPYCRIRKGPLSLYINPKREDKSDQRPLSHRERVARQRRVREARPTIVGLFKIVGRAALIRRCRATFSQREKDFWNYGDVDDNVTTILNFSYNCSDARGSFCNGCVCGPD